MKAVKPAAIAQYLPSDDAGKQKLNPCSLQLISESDIAALMKPRDAFSNKGTYGHVLLLAGSKNTMGAAIIAAGGALHAGAGLLTALLPPAAIPTLNIALPEAMAAASLKKAEKYTCVCAGPGLGKSAAAFNNLKGVQALGLPAIIDADALNMLAENAADKARKPGKKFFTPQPLLYQLPPGSIITPHIKEFDRLFGQHDAWVPRLNTALDKAAEMQAVILLKNRYTFIITPQREIYINSTGTPAMAQGGMGDVLSGIIAAMLAQGLPAADAAIAGAWLHGRAGEQLAAERYCITATQLSLQVPFTMAQCMAHKG